MVPAATVSLQIATGLFAGYVAVAMCESFFHRVIQHAMPATLARWRRVGWFGQAFIKAWYSHHVAHHHLTFRLNHVTQFRDDEERRRLDAVLLRKGMGDVIDASYGARLGPDFRNHLLYVAPTFPIFATVCLFGGFWFTAGAMAPFVIWPMLAQFVHPYLHMRHEEALTRAPLPVRALARTAYFRRLAQHHWLHHRYTDCNYNLLMGGDALLGVSRKPAAEDLDEMRAIGLWVGADDHPRRR